MAGGPPTLQIGAVDALGWVLQPTFGAPVVTPANAKNWAVFTARDIQFDAAQKTVKAAAGKRATERFGARGMSKTMNGFTLPFEPTSGASLLAYFFGLDTYATGTHTITPTTPKMLTIEKLMASQSLQYQDCFLDALDITQQNGEFAAKYTVLGGVGDTPIVSGTPTLPSDTNVFQWGQVGLAAAFGGLTAAEMGNVALQFRNNIRQFPGGGSFAPTRGGGGEFTAAGTMEYLFDSAAAAAAMAAYIAGTTSTVTLTLTVDGTHNIVFTEPNCLMTSSKPVETLVDFCRIQVGWSMLKAEQLTVALQNDDLLAY